MQLLNSDCLSALKDMPDDSVDSIVTDPPYGLKFMGKKWDYDVPTEHVWAECLRVLKPGGHLLAFAGTRTQHRMAVRIEDAGFEIRDMIAWVYGSGFPKSHNLKDEWEGWGTALKPALEPITVARKPFKGTVAANILLHGVGALNIDGCRVELLDGDQKGEGGEKAVKPVDLSGAVYGLGIKSSQPQRDGLGRWPANLIHDGSDEVLEAFPFTKSHGNGNTRINANAGNAVKDKVYNGGWLGKDGTPDRNDQGSAARFFYCAKASKKDRGPNNKHPTVKPTDLMRYLCRLVTPPGGTVLDPFMGSGTTGIAAVQEGFSFVGIEREQEYFEVAKNRIKNLKQIHSQGDAHIRFA